MTGISLIASHQQISEQDTMSWVAHDGQTGYWIYNQRWGIYSPAMVSLLPPGNVLFPGVASALITDGWRYWDGMEAIVTNGVWVTITIIGRALSADEIYAPKVRIGCGAWLPHTAGILTAMAGNGININNMASVVVAAMLRAKIRR